MTPVIDPVMTMSDLLVQFPGARRALFRQYHIGGCSSCGFDPSETLEEVCRRNDNLSVQEVIGFLLQSHEEDQRILMPPAELKALLDAQADGVRVVDIRTREEFEAVHIPGSILFTQEMMQEILSRWERGGTIVFVDHKGERSMDAAAYFLGHGFSAVRALDGGIDAYSETADAALPRYELE